MENMDINTEITPEKFSCHLRISKRLGPFYGCEQGVGRWCWNCPCLDEKASAATAVSEASAQ
ncbi:hypothetical protein LCGC14_1208310 [marine sediment metagenome]|uniref:Uncharacterized protein n=1 Tax=marine sediment metagenome TaxID=412755 RepID=A0A0F9LES7_9ZZZZ